MQTTIESAIARLADIFPYKYDGTGVTIRIRTSPVTRFVVGVTHASTCAPALNLTNVAPNGDQRTAVFHREALQNGQKYPMMVLYNILARLSVHEYSSNAMQDGTAYVTMYRRGDLVDFVLRTRDVE